MKDNADTAQWLSDLFGIRQVSAGATLLKTYKEMDEVIQSIGQSEGVVQSEFDTRMNSTSAKIEQLKQTINQIWEKTISSDFTKGLVIGVTNLIGAFGNLPTVIGLATTALLLFKGKAISDAISGMTGFIASCVTASTATSATAVATDLLSVSMKTLTGVIASNPLGALAVGLTSIIMLFGMASQSAENLKQSNEEFVNSLSKVSSPNNAQALLDTYNQLESQLSNAGLGTEEYKKKEEQLEQTQQKLLDIYPSVNTILDENTGKKRLNAEATQKLIDKDNQLQQAKARKVLSDNGIKDLEDVKDLVKYYNDAYENLKKTNELANTSDKNPLISYETQASKYAEGVENSKAKIEALSGAFSILGDDTGKYTGALDILNGVFEETSNKAENTSNKVELVKKAVSNVTVGKIDTSTIDELNKTFPNLNINSENARDKLSDLKKILANLGEGASTEEIARQIEAIGTSAEDSEDKLDKLSKAFKGLSSTNSDIDSIIKDLKKYGKITEESYGKIIDNPKVLKALSSEGDVIQNLTNLQNENKESMSRNLKEAINRANGISDANQLEADSKKDSDYQKLSSDSETNSQIQQNASDTVDNNSGNYEADSSNFESVQGSKSSADANFENWWRKNTSDSVNSNADMYKTDVQNFVNAMNSKMSMISSFKKKIASMSDAFKPEAGGIRMADKLSQPWNSGLREATDNLLGTDTVGAYESELGSKLALVNQQIADANSEVQKLGNSFLNMANNIDDSPIEFAYPEIEYTNGGGGAGGSGGSNGSSGGKSGKSDEEKAQEEAEKFAEKLAEKTAEIDVDKYYKINNAIAEIDNALELNKTLQEDLYGADLESAKQQEIQLMKKKQDALVALNNQQQQELMLQRKILEEKGFVFNADGNIINQQEKLQELADAINNKTYENSEEGLKQKEDEIDALKELQDELKNYTDLNTSKIPSVTKQWRELNNEIKSGVLSSLKETIDKQKEMYELQLEEKNNAESKALEDLKNQYEEAHNQRLDELNEELDALEENNEEEERENTLLEKKNALKQAELDLERAKNQKTVYSYKKQEDGTYQFSWEADKDAVKSAQDSYDSAKKDLKDTKDNYELEDQKKEIQEQIDEENKLYEAKQKEIEDYESALSESYERQKKLLDYYYQDTDKLAQESLNKLTQTYGDNFETISQVVNTKLDETKSKLDELNKANIGYDLETINKALSSENIYEYVTSIQEQTDKGVSINLEGLKQRLSDIEIQNGNMETAIETHYTTTLTTQSNYQTNSRNSQEQYQQEYLDSFILFSAQYVTLYDKMMQLIKMITDSGTNDIATMVQGAGQQVLNELIESKKAYDKFRDMWNYMHPDDTIPNVDISSVVSDFNAYKQSVADWQKSKEELFYASNNPLYSQDKYDKYIQLSQVGMTNFNALASAIKEVKGGGN